MWEIGESTRCRDGQNNEVHRTNDACVADIFTGRYSVVHRQGQLDVSIIDDFFGSPRVSVSSSTPAITRTTCGGCFQYYARYTCNIDMWAQRGFNHPAASFDVVQAARNASSPSLLRRLSCRVAHSHRAMSVGPPVCSFVRSFVGLSVRLPVCLIDFTDWQRRQKQC